MPLTSQELQAGLWHAVDIAGGRASPLDYRKHVSSLLFLKWLSDHFNDEVEAAVAAGVPRDIAVDDPEEHQFAVPASCRWERITATPLNLGEALGAAGRAIEEANPGRMDGLLTGTDWNDLPGQAGPVYRDQVIRNLLNHFSALDLRKENLQSGRGRAANVVGEAYQQFIHRFADSAVRWGGNFLTPPSIARLVVELLQPREDMRICDPALGSASMLINVASYVEREGGDPLRLALYGQELNPDVLAMGKLGVLLHGLSAAGLEAGDVFTEPALLDAESRLLRFDRVIAHPPFGLRNWGREFALSDPHHRFDHYGPVPPRSRGEIAFLLHMLATTKPDGMAAAVVPHGVLYRGGAEARIRRGMVKDDVLEAVIGLPSNLFFGNSIPVAICVFNRAKSDSRRGRTLFVDAAQDGYYRPGRGRNHLDPEHVDRIVATCRTFADAEGFAHVADVAEIAANDYNLNINRYVDTAERPAMPSVADALTRVRNAERRHDEAVAEMDALLAGLGFTADR